jgi:hypothetical protein
VQFVVLIEQYWQPPWHGTHKPFTPTNPSSQDDLHCPFSKNYPVLHTEHVLGVKVHSSQLGSHLTATPLTFTYPGGTVSRQLEFNPKKT